MSDLPALMRSSLSRPKRIFEALSRPLVPMPPGIPARKPATQALLILVSALLLGNDVLNALIAGHRSEVLIAATLLMFGCYLLSRTPRYALAGVGALLILLITPPLAIFSNPTITITQMFYVLDTLLVLTVLMSFIVPVAFGLVVTLGAFVATMVIGRTTASYTIQPYQMLEIIALLGGVQIMILILRNHERQERTLAQQALRVSEARFRAIVEDQSELICRWLPDGTLTFVNEAYARFHDRPREEMPGRSLYDLLLPQEAAVARQIHRPDTRPNALTFVEMSYDRPERETRWIAWTIRTVFNGEGRVAEYQSVGRDITERKQIEYALRMSEARFRAIVEDQRDMICRWLPDGTLTFVNEAYSQFHHHTPDQLLSIPFYKFISPSESEESQRLFAQGQARATVYNEMCYERPEQEPRWIAWANYPIFNSTGKLIEYQSVGRDITGQKRSENALRANQARYRAIVEEQSDLICRWLPDGTITFVNTAYARAHGRPAAEYVGQRIPDLVPPYQRPIIEAEINAVMESRKPLETTRYFVTQSGERYWMRWSNIPIFNEQGEMIEVQSVGHDLTQIRATEEALKTSEARYRSMIELQRDLIMRWKPDLTITYVNDVYSDYHEMPHDAMLGKTILDLTHDANERQLIIDHLDTNMPIQAVSEHAEYFLSPSGKRYWIRWIDIPVFDENGVIVEYHTVGHDLTVFKQAQEAEREALGRYEALVNSVTGVVWEANPQTLATHFMSQQAESLLGFPREAFYADPLLWQSRIHPEDHPFVLAYSRAQIAVGHNFEVEYRYMTPGGRIIWLHDTVSLVLDAAGSAQLMRGVSIDVTAAKQAQEIEQEQRRFSEALRETSTFISGTLDLDEVLNRILAVIPRVLPGGITDIMMIENGESYVVRSRGYAERGLAEAISALRISIDEDEHLRYMIETGEALLIDDVRDEEDWHDEGVSGWVRSQMTAPIRLLGETIGFLTVSDDKPRTYTPKHAHQLQSFADQVSIAIRNARLYSTVQRYADHLEVLVAQRTAELELERQRLQIILDSTGEGIFYTEGDTIRFANAAIARLTGFSTLELDGLSVRALEVIDKNTTYSDSGVDTLHSILHALTPEAVWRDEMRLRRRDGSIFDAGLTVSVIDVPHTPTDPAGEASPRAVTIVRDISREKALALQKSLFVAHASHELRTPLTNFKTRLYLLRRTPQRLEEHLTILDAVTERMRRLVEDLLDISRFERGIIPMQRESLDIVALVRGILAIQQSEADLRQQQLTSMLPDKPVMVMVDKERITQVITNLLTNALNYTAEGGQVKLMIECVEAQAAPGQNEASHISGQVMIRVHDTGVGIRPEDVAHIFQPFFRVVSTVEGTGLGLSISKAIAEQHGGTIEVASQFGQGSIFTLCLPYSQAPAAMNFISAAQGE